MTRTTPAYSPEAERSLIGALILDPVRASEAFERVAPADFFDPAIQAIAQAILNLTTRLKPVEFVSIAAELDALGKLKAIGGPKALFELSEDARHSAYLLHHVEVVRDSSRLRRWQRFIGDAERSLSEAAPGSDAANALMDDLETQAVKLNMDSAVEAERTDEIAPRVTRKLLQDQAPGEFDGLPTGLIDVDRVLLGMQPGDLIVLAARPGMGKTAFALNVLRHALTHDEPRNGLLASCEMGRDAIVRRMVCEHANVSAQEIRRTGAFGTAREKLQEAETAISALPLTIDDQPAQTLIHLRSACLREKRKRGLSLVVVDYLQLMRAPKADSRQEEVAEISRGLKGLARELEVPVLALSQLSRRVEHTDAKRPCLADLRESGAIEQDADQVVFLFRPAYYEKEPTDRSLCEVIISKNRNGPTGFVNVNFDAPTMRFSNRCIETVERTVIS